MTDQHDPSASCEVAGGDAHPRYAAPEVLDLGKAEDLILGSGEGNVWEFWPPYGLWC
jgi:hypothetical protein